MWTRGLIHEASERCVESFTKCLEFPALQENQWAENRLADMNLWISNIGACARGRASLDSRLASRPDAHDVILNLLRLLAILIDECRTQQHTEAPSCSQDNKEDAAPIEEESQGRAFSPWSDDSSSDGESKKGYDVKSPLAEAMYNIESMQDQLARIALAIRRSGRRSRLQKADQRFDVAEHQELEGHLVGMLLTQLKRYPSERDSSSLSETQLRLIRCNLKRRNRFLYAQTHSKALDAGFTRRENSTAMQEQPEAVQEEMIRAKASAQPSNDETKNARSTTITATSASKLSDSFNIPQPTHLAPATSSMISVTAINLDYPRSPRLSDNAHYFRCPCCCEVLPVTMAERNTWRKHIADDLSPYTCVLANCDQPDVLFNTKESWQQHMLRDHSSLTYWICFACDDGSRFNSREAFVQHTKSNHAATISADQIQIIVDLSEKTTPAEIRQCPLCNWPEEEELEVDKDALLSHIAKDVHSFSLRALPWADSDGQENNEGIHSSYNKVYEWLIQNGIQTGPWSVPSPGGKSIRDSDYFRENAYFAGSSKASSSSEVKSSGSRELELDELRKLEGPESPWAVDMEFPEQPRGKKTNDTPNSKRSDREKRESYTVAWICALSIELEAATLCLDEEYPDLPIPRRDASHYILGRVGIHNVVIVSPSSMVEPPWFIVTTDMLKDFPNIDCWLSIGVGGGVPSSRHDIRLGDVVVGTTLFSDGSVYAFDFGKRIKSTSFQPKEPLVPQLPAPSEAMNKLMDNYELYRHGIEAMVDNILTSSLLQSVFRRPDANTDQLYNCHIVHPLDQQHTHTSNSGDVVPCLILRPPRYGNDRSPVIHYGNITSVNKIIKDASIRDELAAEQDILCFETEAFGLLEYLPCLVIRGICDYADSHKTSDWQGYAALVAAAYAKAVLHHVVATETKQFLAEISHSTTQLEVPSLFKCPKLGCGREFNSKFDMEAHVLSVHASEVYETSSFNFSS